MTPCREHGLHRRDPRPICAFVKAPPDSVLRYVYLGLGWLLIALTPVVGALPGPGGIFLFAGGAAPILAIVPQILASMLLFPIVARLCARLDVWRLR